MYYLCIPDVLGFFAERIFFLLLASRQTILRMCFNLCHFMPCCVCLFVFPFLHFISSQFLAIFSCCLHVIHLSAALVNTLNLFINLCVLFSIYFVGLSHRLRFPTPIGFLPVVLFPSRRCHSTCTENSTESCKSNENQRNNLILNRLDFEYFIMHLRHKEKPKRKTLCKCTHTSRLDFPNRKHAFPFTHFTFILQLKFNDLNTNIHLRR